MEGGGLRVDLGWRGDAWALQVKREERGMKLGRWRFFPLSLQFSVQFVKQLKADTVLGD
jgi:hypothetical protein